MEKMKSSKFWWLNAHNSPKRSTCLQSTIQELDEKTMSILKIIEEDADSLAQRANMYYRKRPQLISMVEDLYRSHRSLAENFYAAKLESRNCFKSKLPDKSGSAPDGCGGYDTYAESFDSDQCCSESEVDDPDTEDEMEVLDEVSSGLVMGQEIVKLRQEMERLQDENRSQQEALVHKDEEKREVIRQLSLAVDMMKEENLKLRRSLAAATAEHSSPNKKWNITPLQLFFSKT
uniref:NAB domain-containing protein n=1 Tax=Kalanchoe fedtschenkoi TaxID=63787 RepID=A0A7N0UMF5_KALFE